MKIKVEPKYFLGIWVKHGLFTSILGRARSFHKLVPEPGTMKSVLCLVWHPSDERIQILQESCKMIQNLQDSCKNLARYQSRPKNKSGYNCFRKHLWSKFLFTEQVTKPNSMKKKLARIQNLARILQDINQGQKINLGTIVLGNIFEASFCLLNKLRSPIQWKKN